MLSSTTTPVTWYSFPVHDLHLFFQNLTPDERTILAEGCLMNFYASQK